MADLIDVLLKVLGLFYVARVRIRIHFCSCEVLCIFVNFSTEQHFSLMLLTMYFYHIALHFNACCSYGFCQIKISIYLSFIYSGINDCYKVAALFLQI